MTLKAIDLPTTKPSSEFLSYRYQIETIKEWNKLFNWNFTEKDFYPLSTYPKNLENLKKAGKFQFPVLDIKFETVEDTFNNFWKVVSLINPNSYKWNGIKTDISHLYTIEGIDHKPTLSWKVLEIDIHKKTSVRDLRNDTAISFNRFPSSSVLWMVAYLLKWSTDNFGFKLGNFINPKYHLGVPGYKIKLSNQRHYTEILLMRWDSGENRIILETADYRYRNENLILPILQN